MTSVSCTAATSVSSASSPRESFRKGFARMAVRLRRPADWGEPRRAGARAHPQDGEASVHPLVDLSNYVMFTVGQPTHVYDGGHLSLPLSADFTTEDRKSTRLNSSHLGIS